MRDELCTGPGGSSSGLGQQVGRSPQRLLTHNKLAPRIFTKVWILSWKLKSRETFKRQFESDFQISDHHLSIPVCIYGGPCYIPLAHWFPKLGAAPTEQRVLGEQVLSMGNCGTEQSHRHGTTWSETHFSNKRWGWEMARRVKDLAAKAKVLC